MQRSTIDAGAPTGPRGKLDRGLLAAGALVLLAAATAAMSPALPGGFLWDDIHQIQKNPWIAAPDGPVHFWTSTQQPDYWPVSFTVLWAQWRIFGGKPAGMRGFNILLHAACAWLVWRILVRWDAPGGFAVALVFAVHPVAVEAVAWIVQTKTLLAAALAYASLWTWLRWRADGKLDGYLASIGFFLAALLAKTSVVMWPPTILLATWWQERRLDRRSILLSLPFFLLSLTLGLVGVWFQWNRSMAGVVVRDDDLLSRLALAGRAFWFYAGKVVWPFELSFIYPRWELPARGWAALLPMLGLCLVAGLAWRYRRSWGRAVLAGGGFYFLNLFPVLGFLDIYYMRYSLVADHWQYLAMPGLLALLVGAAFAGGRAAGRWLGAPRRAEAGLWLVTLLVAAGCLHLARERALVFSDADHERLWRAATFENPNAWMPHNNLALILSARGRTNEAIEENRRAIELAPGAPEPYFDLGVLLHQAGDLQGAEESYRRCLELRPSELRARVNLASLLESMGRAREALAQWQAAAATPTQNREIAELCRKAVARLQHQHDRPQSPKR